MTRRDEGAGYPINQIKILLGMFCQLMRKIEADTR